MHRLIALKSLRKNYGFTILELLIACIIIGVLSTVTVPNLIASQRRDKANEAFSKVKNALIEAQSNANRLSGNCVVTIAEDVVNNEYDITAAPSGCILETFSVDKNIVTIASTGSGSSFPRTVNYNFRGEIPVSNMQTFWFYSNDFSGNAIANTGKCIVLSNSLGMIRTGVYNGGSCENLQNKRYDNSL